LCDLIFTTDLLRLSSENAERYKGGYPFVNMVTVLGLVMRTYDH